MKGFFSVLLAVLACFCLVQDGAAWTKVNRNDMKECIRRNGNIGDAIFKFCRGNPKIMVPSPFAKEGVWSSKGKVSAWIRGTCKPKQYVPEGYCLAQMWNMCVNMGPKGNVRARYGKGGCQDWHLKVF